MSQRFDPLGDTAADLAQARREIARIDALSVHHDVREGGTRIRWRRFGEGEGPPLVLLHGGHGSWMHWIRNIEALSKRHALWLPDLPGFNDSDVPPSPREGQARLDPALDVLTGTLDSLIGAHTEIDLGGFSFGGFFAARLAARRGGVRRLALLGSGGHATRRRMSVEMINWRSASTRAEESAALMHNLGALMIHEPAAIDALAFEIHDVSCHGTRFRSKEVSLAGGLREALDLYGGAALLAWGEHDVTADPASTIAALCARHEQRQGRVIDGAGHWVQYERAGSVNMLLSDFFD